MSPRGGRTAVIALGLAAASYGTASLTGGWLGTPPWWEMHTSRTWRPGDTCLASGDYSPWIHDQRPTDSAYAAATIAIGLALAASGARPRRRRLDIAS